MSNKYLVLKIDDIHEAAGQEVVDYINSVGAAVATHRESIGKVGSHDFFVINVSTDKYAQAAIETYLDQVVDDIEKLARHNPRAVNLESLENLRLAAVRARRISISSKNPRHPD
jgi:hypothetical protein